LVASHVVGKVRSPWLVIIFSIITLGIYALYWQYASFKEGSAARSGDTFGHAA
jgi:hypothetical protein